ncbi:putative toxin-antitoxin system toxin component, PIN family [Cupriavidus sp. AU9028]|uniref:putative toxin-antitoxin system toxin component, PIN family n=1 Tax=Cupriavidus sp. AU9028 TaxID=2871157 RepID=UPI001C976843|nr:putative toxin-antitoxin system toxin component, PIN family [Cupriavidus sp. AU9028]MBY4895799.1 putative toxin-antitoxin system toxin component, PIN family [Cupriavidus sp. AU9028]
MATDSTAGTAPAPGRAPGATPAAQRPQGSATPVVLDSNIWIDLLVFRDPHAEPIRAALDAGTIAPLMRADCREELRRVLAYPQFERFNVDIAGALSIVDALVTAVEPPPSEDAETIRLPRCRDTDDQKFIELAHFAGAACLVSKDKAVLKLASRLRRSSGVEVLTPQRFAPWLAARGLQAEAA